MKYPELLLGIQPDGTIYGVVNEYEQIRAFIGNIIEFMHRGNGANSFGMIIDEEALLKPELNINLAASLIMQYPIYGNVIVCGSEPDMEGDTMPPTRKQREFAEYIAAIVDSLLANAATVGQDLTLHPNPATVPAPTITSFDEGEFEEWLQQGGSI